VQEVYQLDGQLFAGDPFKGLLVQLYFDRLRVSGEHVAILLQTVFNLVPLGLHGLCLQNQFMSHNEHVHAEYVDEDLARIEHDHELHDLLIAVRLIADVNQDCLEFGILQLVLAGLDGALAEELQDTRVRQILFAVWIIGAQHQQR